MTPRKSQTEALPLTPAPKSVPYPPASIWKTKEDGTTFEFRGNSFARRGNLVTRVPAVTAAGSEDKKSAGG